MARTKAPHSLASRLNERKVSASEVLDELLPWPSRRPSSSTFTRRCWRSATRRNSWSWRPTRRCRPFLLCRLAPDVALVDPGRAEELAEVLRRRGFTPRSSSREPAMNEAAGQPVPFLYSPVRPPSPAGLEHINLTDPAQEGVPMA